MTDVSNFTDEQLIKYIRDQDNQKYAEIITRYKTKLMRYAVYLTRDESKASDVVQEAFIKAYININSFNLDNKFSSWIYRIVHNEAMTVLRKTQNHISMLEDFDWDCGINIEDEFIKKELQAHANECLTKIPIIYREPLSLYFLENRSYEEISDILRIPIGTVGTRINRAKAIMKKIC